MEPKKVSLSQLLGVVGGMEKDPDGAVGSYLFKRYRIQVSKYQASGSERVLQLYNRRRKQGKCIMCGVPADIKCGECVAVYEFFCYAIGTDMD